MKFVSSGKPASTAGICAHAGVANSIRGMRFAFILLAALAVMAPVLLNAQAPKPRATREAERAQALKTLDRAFELKPQRRDVPLRELNISDDEVREVQLVAQGYIPKTLLNISPVVAGCPCEEGPQCTDQVYLIAENSPQAKGLQLSRVKKAWRVGVVQEWWFKYEALRANTDWKDYMKYESDLNELLREFPTCVGELVPAGKTVASTPKAEAK